VKGQVELAELARRAGVPVLFVGRPFHPDDPYWLRFNSLIDGRWVCHRPHVETQQEMIALLQAARGFVLHSDYENWSLAASEATACGLPLLLPDRKWSRERFGDQAHYFSRSSQQNVELLRQFHHEAAQLRPPELRLMTWTEVGQQLESVYAEVLRNSR
jgi:glycosyltransferase involved in cell wall biosynthesis